MSGAEQRRLPVTPKIYDSGAERLFDAVASTCDPRSEFAARVESGLRSSLSLLATDPVLARTLTVSADLNADAQRRRQHWHERFAMLLGAAAAATLDGHPQVDFMEAPLISGASLLIAHQVLSGKARDLRGLLPNLYEFVLAFYLDPSEVARHRRRLRAAR